MKSKLEIIFSPPATNRRISTRKSQTRKQGGGQSPTVSESNQNSITESKISLKDDSMESDGREKKLEIVESDENLEIEGEPFSQAL